jgi:hypothetical protein
MTTENKRKTKNEHEAGQPRFMKGKRPQISLSISAENVDKLDERAAKKGISRAALLNIIITNYLEN